MGQDSNCTEFPLVCSSPPHSHSHLLPRDLCAFCASLPLLSIDLLVHMVGSSAVAALSAEVEAGDDS